MRLQAWRQRKLAGHSAVKLPLLIGTLMTCLLIAAVYLSRLPVQDYSGDRDGSKSGAWSITKQFVEASLKCPSTAEFPWGYRDRVTSLGNGRYRVVAYVDAQNGFGAMIRLHFRAVVKHEGGDTYRLESLETLEQ